MKAATSSFVLSMLCASVLCVSACAAHFMQLRLRMGSAVLALLGSKAKLDEAEQVLSGVSLISTKTLLEKAISGRPDPGILHVYLGYAGWSNDQLRKEVELGSWFIFQGDARTIFDSDPNSLWPQMIQKTEGGRTPTRGEPRRILSSAYLWPNSSATYWAVKTFLDLSSAVDHP